MSANFFFASCRLRTLGAGLSVVANGFRPSTFLGSIRCEVLRSRTTKEATLSGAAALAALDDGGADCKKFPGARPIEPPLVSFFASTQPECYIDKSRQQAVSQGWAKSQGRTNRRRIRAL